MEELRKLYFRHRELQGKSSESGKTLVCSETKREGSGAAAKQVRKRMIRNESHIE